MSERVKTMAQAIMEEASSPEAVMAYWSNVVHQRDWALERIQVLERALLYYAREGAHGFYGVHHDDVSKVGDDENYSYVSGRRAREALSAPNDNQGDKSGS